MKRAIVYLMIVLTLGGCVSLSAQDEKTAQELKSYGLKQSWTQPKNVFLAGLLNVLPVAGNLYLSAGKDGDSSQIAYGVLNFFFIYPLSILWAVPQAAIDAHTLNKKAFVDYYTFDKAGQKELDALKAERHIDTLSYLEDDEESDMDE
ncbi:MAG TPA: hypothetical protein DD624_02125 [Alphaproteobacteria bacterium]|nr:hypothetical protein [Alphaproteobacteria bacterium]